MTATDILNKLPYEKPFLFVDTLHAIDEHGVSGTFCFRKELDFYKGHFRKHPVTPGVILTEVMAQIGLVCLGIYLTGNGELQATSSFALTSTQIEFYKPVYPGERVKVDSVKEYFRFGKLKCRVAMRNEQEEIVCDGIISGMIITDTK